ncbi:MAG: hypothetical protein CEE40_08295 [Chloroflexi bacterium B3_Chlor]|nr:MAG: hypothetical protein CEE40_08295 [Chloroflexi bacterium B3_Chlor]
MQIRRFKPSPRYLVKLCIGITALAVLSVAGTFFLGLVIPDREATLAGTASGDRKTGLAPLPLSS